MVRAICILLFIIQFTNTHAQCLKGNCMEGYGEIRYSSGSVYKGEFHDGYRHGKGIMAYANGDKFIGKWNFNKKNGKGKMIPSSGEYFLAVYSNDEITEELNTSSTPQKAKPEQNTALVSNQNTTYDIQANKDCNQNHCHNENGIFFYKDGTKYTGSFVSGLPSGVGIVEYTNGDKYEGGWNNHAMQGEGTVIFSTGNKMHAMWDRGMPKEQLKYRRNDVITKLVSQKEVSEEVKIWAVIVGVASYNHMPTLKYTDDDAYKMYAFLKSPEGGALPDEQISVLIDDMATREEILGSMERLFLKADENDVIMLYFSGHGLDGSFIPYDFDGYKNELYHDEVQEIFAMSEAKQKVCFADACYSGSYTSRSTLQESIASLYESYNEANAGTALLLSSKENETSLEYKGLRQGVYSHFLIRGLKGEADNNGDHIVDITELFGFVQRGVKNYTANEQSPILVGNYDESMPVAMRRSDN